MPLNFDTRQLPEIRAFLARLKPGDELAYRLALRGLFPRFRGHEWSARIDTLMVKLAKDRAALARFHARAREIADRIKAGG